MTQKQKPKLNWTYAGNDRSKRYVGGCEQQPGKTFTQSSKSQAYRGCCRLHELERSHQPTTAPSELYSRVEKPTDFKTDHQKNSQGQVYGWIWSIWNKETCSVPSVLQWPWDSHSTVKTHFTGQHQPRVCRHHTLHLLPIFLPGFWTYLRFSHLRNFPTREFSLPFISHSNVSLIPPPSFFFY